MFKNAQINTRVYSRLHGKGFIKTPCTYNSKYIFVVFDNGITASFLLDGRENEHDVEPTLFFVDGDNLYSLTPPIDWNNVAQGDLLVVSDVDDFKDVVPQTEREKFISIFEGRFITENKNGKISSWKYAIPVGKTTNEEVVNWHEVAVGTPVIEINSNKNYVGQKGYFISYNPGTVKPFLIAQSRQKTGDLLYYNCVCVSKIELIKVS